jgi:hypothetical protein
MDLHRDIPLQKMHKYADAMEFRIIEIAKSQDGVFGVSPRYRDDLIRRCCKRMVKRGIFKQVRRGVFESYKLVNKTP